MAGPVQAQGAASNAAPDPSLRLPRILCLHGGGTNAVIFHMQCRVLRFHMGSTFRFVFADAPFHSRPGPDVETVFADYGPFRSWLPLNAEGNLYAAAAKVDTIAPEDAARVYANLAEAMRADDAAGATGPWVATLGFSQGAKMAACLLWRQQVLNESRGQAKDTWAQLQQEQEEGGDDLNGLPETDFRFGVLLAGRPPLVSLGPNMQRPGFLRLPTVHVHGRRDPGIVMHRELLNKCCDKATTRLVEWDGDHRVPIRTPDVTAIVTEVMAVAKETGVLES